MYNINPYAFATAIVGALKEEINKREELEKTVKNDVLSYRLCSFYLYGGAI